MPDVKSSVEPMEKELAVSSSGLSEYAEPIDRDLHLKTILYEQFSFFWLILTMGIPVGVYFVPYLGDLFQPGIFFSYLFVFFLIGLILRITGHPEAGWYLMGAVFLAVSLIFRDLGTMLNSFLSLGFFAVVYYLARAEKKIRLPSQLVFILLFSTLFLFRKDSPAIVVICLIGLGLGFLREVIAKGQKYGLVPILLLQFLLLFVPVKDSPLKWTFFINLAYSIGERADLMYQDMNYLLEGLNGKGISFVGYSEHMGLSGGVYDRDREDLYLKSYGKVNYLRGKCYETLTPEGLADPCADPVYNAYLVRLMNALYSEDVSQEMAECFLKNRSGEVTYHYLRTHDLLIDPHTYRLDERYKNGLEQLSGKGTSVSYHYLEIDYANPYLVEILQDSPREDHDFETIRAYTRKILKLDLKEYMTPEEYRIALSYDPRTEAAYLDTSMATDRIRNMTEDVIRGCENDFDKAKAIETYLRSYEYDPGVDLSSSENYIDDFLFQTQSGYCVHYASAMTLMLRISGIPSRYCVGYLHRDRDQKAVLSSESHAWAEAYLENVGWVPFEPTGIYSSAEDMAWGERIKDPEKDPDEEESEAYEGEITPAPVHRPSDYRDPEADGKNEKKNRVDWEMIRTFSVYFLLLLLVLVLILGLYKLLKAVYYRRLSFEERMKVDVAAIRRRLEQELPKGTVVESFDQYLEVVRDETLRNRIAEIFSDYYRMRFREDPVEEEYVAGVHAFANEFAGKKKL